LWTHLKSIHNEKYVKFKKKLEAKRVIEGMHLELFKFFTQVILEFRQKKFPIWQNFGRIWEIPSCKNSSNPKLKKYFTGKCSESATKKTGPNCDGPKKGVQIPGDGEIMGGIGQIAI
jgi:hypothetical protein